jgi:type VII secretion-associated protein (TIGR03931 family)
VKRVSVQAGGAWLRVATEGRLLVALPADGVDIATVLHGLFDKPIDELLVVHPGVRPVPGGATAPAGALRAVPAALAALADHAGAGGSPLEDAVVVDVGHRGTEVARVVAGRVAEVRRVPVGGERLDAATAGVLAHDGAPVPAAEARRVREALSLLPGPPTGGAATPRIVVPADELRSALAAALSPVVDAVRIAATSAGPDPSPVLLVGGVARTPLLAELLDAAGIEDVRVPARPDTAAVTGALRLPACGWPAGDANADGRATSAPPLPPSWLPPVAPARHRRSRLVLGALAAAAALAALLVAGVALPAPTRSPPPVGELVQYGYAVDLPAGWAHTGGLPERRRSLLTPRSAPDGSDLISVERTPLGYDADAEPARARAELHVRFAAAVAAGAALSGFDDDARYAGRAVVVYRESGGASNADVDWYLVLDGDAQLSVGCRHTPAGTATVRAACVTVVGSLRRTE